MSLFKGDILCEKNPRACLALIIASIAMLVMMLSLGSCGFSPMYSQTDVHGKSVRDDYKDIEIANIPDRDGQQLRNNLIDRIYLSGRPDNAHYSLNVTKLKKTVNDIGIQKDATYTRAEMVIDVTVDFVDKISGKVLMERNLHSAGGYNLLDDQYATVVSEQAVTNDLLDEMSDNIVTEINLFLHREGATPPPVIKSSPKIDGSWTQKYETPPADH